MLALAHHLDVPLRERNALLLAAGYAPRYAERDLDDPEMATARTSIQRLLDAHDPYPGVVVDRAWNIVLANAAAGVLAAGVPDEVLGTSPNVYRLCLHPRGLAPRTTNFVEWAGHLLDQLRRSIVLTDDPALAALEDEVRSYPNVVAIAPLITDAPPDDSTLLVPFRVATPQGELSMFTTLTSFGTPRDVTLAELAIELFYPADARSAALLGGAGVRAATTR